MKLNTKKYNYPEMKLEVKRYFRKDIERLEKLLNKDLSDCKRWETLGKLLLLSSIGMEKDF